MRLVAKGLYAEPAALVENWVSEEKSVREQRKRDSLPYGATTTVTRRPVDVCSDGEPAPFEAQIFCAHLACVDD